MKTALVTLFVLLAAILSPLTVWADLSSRQLQILSDQAARNGLVSPYDYPSSDHYGYGGYPVAGYGQDVRANQLGASATINLGHGNRFRVAGSTASVKTTQAAPALKPEVIVVQKPAEPVAVVETTNKPTLKLVDATTGMKICTISDWKQKDLRPNTTDIVFTRGEDKREIARYRVLGCSDGKAYVQAVGPTSPFKANDNVRVDYID